MVLVPGLAGGRATGLCLDYRHTTGPFRETDGTTGGGDGYTLIRENLAGKVSPFLLLIRHAWGRYDMVAIYRWWWYDGTI